MKEKKIKDEDLKMKEYEDVEVIKEGIEREG